MLPELTEGAIDRIVSVGEAVDEPILQVLGYKKLTSRDGNDMYRLLLSDGVNSNSFILLASELNELVTSGTLTNYSIIRMKDYRKGDVNSDGTWRRVIVITKVDVLVPGNEVGQILGLVAVDNAAGAKNAGTNGNNRAHDDPPRPVQNQQVTPRATAEAANTIHNLNAVLSSGASGFNTMPIAALSPYHNRWIIKARVTNKSSVRTWSNARGAGKLFNMDLLDESGEIRCTAYKELCDKFHDVIEIGKVYYITRCQLKLANKQFNNLQNVYEMTMTNDTEIVACDEESQDIPQVHFNFKPISAIERKQKDELIGSITFIPDSYDGRASDNYITQNSKFLNYITPGDLVLADRGFEIEEALSLLGSTMKIPSFTRGKKQLHPVELEDTREIANVRIHIERVIGLLKQIFTILSNKVFDKFLACFSSD